MHYAQSFSADRVHLSFLDNHLKQTPSTGVDSNMLEKESITTDVLVVGGGVSGLGAALAARTHGVSVRNVDEITSTIDFLNIKAI